MAKRAVVALFAVLFLTLSLAPMAEARAGGSFSFHGGSYMSQGSRGFRTFDAPMQRSLTPQPTTGAGSPYGAGYGSYHPFWTGLAGGFFGGWLGSMLFPHWGSGYGSGSGFGSVIGSIVSLLVILWLVRFAVRAFVGRSAVPAMLGSGTPHPIHGGYGGAMPAAAAARQSAPLAIAGTDYRDFETILQQVQQAWSNGDLAGLRPAMTPEMLSYFADTLAQNQSNGVQNHVENVALTKGDLREAWDEGRMHYASCALRWRANDYTVRLDRRPGDPDYVVEGDPRQPTEAAETWTFARSPGGRWMLSAIQQV